MSFTLKFSSAILDSDGVKAKLSRLVRVTALHLVKEIKSEIQRGNAGASGRTYKRGRITKAASGKTKALKLRHYVTAKGNQRAIVGYKYHKASKKGFAPAIDSGGLFGSVNQRRISDLKSRVFAGKKYASILDDPKKLNRPFFEVVLKRHEPTFVRNVKTVLGVK